MGAIGYIYKTTNLSNGRVYIGQKISKKYNPKYYGSGSLIQRDIYINGVDNFANEVLEWCDTIEELNTREIYWIKYYNSTNLDIGYNILRGGLNNKHSKETKLKISNKIKEAKRQEKNKPYNVKVMQKQDELIKNKITNDLNRRKKEFFNKVNSTLS